MEDTENQPLLQTADQEQDGKWIYHYFSYSFQKKENI